ncbi:MAG: signal recognition particle protein [Alphaproteobacteria bacterium]|nr:signal recognition particle protein [Alphaproteobacteria bacterium]
MFSNLSTRLSKVFDQLTKRGLLSENDVDAALREIRIALLEADVALSVVKNFIHKVREKAVGEVVLKSITPAQMVVKIVYDQLVEMLGSDHQVLNLNAPAPLVFLMVGLQGSGKTTTSAKIGYRFKNQHNKKVLLASLDTQRPGAQHQLEVLGEQASLATLPIVPNEQPLAITKRAFHTAKTEGYDLLILDSAGRLHIDQSLMDEIKEIKNYVNPIETLLVSDSMTGQDAVNIATSFQESLGVTGIVLTRIDGDGRGGAALSMREVTGCPIKLLGIGEKLDALEDFHPSRIANRILGMGDIVSLVEKASQNIEQEEAEELARKMQKGQFTLDDMAKQLKTLQKMGGMGSVMAMLPGMGKIQKQLNDAKAKIDEKQILRQHAIITSMTKKERKMPDIIKASRKQRIAKGSGTSVHDVNKLLKQYYDMQRMMKQVGKLGQKGLLRHGLSALVQRPR